MRKIMLGLILTVMGSVFATAQVAINTDGSLPDNSAMLDVKSTQKGILVPRMLEAERNSILNPATGLLVYQTNGTAGFYYNSGSSTAPVWTYIGSGGGGGLTLPYSGSTSHNDFAFAVANSLNSGIIGKATNSSGTLFGVQGESASATGAGMYGLSTPLTGATYGAIGQSNSSTGTGTLGVATGNSGLNFGVKGQSFSTSGTGVLGEALNASGATIGIKGLVNSTSGYSGYFVGGRFYSEGNVGIGTTNPTSPLLISKAVNPATPLVRLHNQQDDPVIVAMRSPYHTYYLGQNKPPDNPAQYDAFYIYDSTAAATRLIIDTYGHVGIGTLTPYYPLHVSFTSASENQPCIYAVDNYSGSAYNTPVAIKGEIKSASVTYSKGAIQGFHNNTGGASAGVYGETNSTAGFGLRGKNNPSLTEGYIGGEEYGVRGINNGSGFSGSLGSDNCGVYGTLGLSYSYGDYGIYGYLYPYSAAGIGYTFGSNFAGVAGLSFNYNEYSFGMAGFITSTPGERSGAVLGAHQLNSAPWGCLMYKTSTGSEYGGYFTSTTTGTGKSSTTSDMIINSGLGSWGDLFGADIHGNIYGTFTEGTNYGLFSNGHIIQNKLDIHLQENEDLSNTILFSNVSTEVTVQTSGYGRLSDGICQVNFDENFRKVASSEYPIVITVTPIGNSQGIHLEQVGKDGFTVAENNAGKSNLDFTYIAVARRKGYEQPQLPLEVVDQDYVSKLTRGLHNDGDTQTDGEGLYYSNGELVVGKPLSTPK